MVTQHQQPSAGATAAAPIEVEGLTKRYGRATVVDDLTFRVRAGAVTGFLGPNGSGKTTTLRMLLGLAEPTAGRASVFGRRFAALDDPARTVGAALEVSGFHPGRSGRNHLRALAATAGLDAARVDEVLELVELAPAAGKRVGTYSLGMRQRLALAAALLGDPPLLVLDEPANGLDPRGIRWLRDVLRAQARQGRTVLVSSHVLAEVAQTVDDVVVIAAGRSVYHGPVAGLAAGGRAGAFAVRTPEPDRLGGALERAGGTVTPGDDGQLLVGGLSDRRIAEVGLAQRALIVRLEGRDASLEDAFLRLTTDAPTTEGS